MTSSQQRLTTERLLLRSWVESDRPLIGRILSNPRFAMYVGDGHPRDGAGVDRWYSAVQEEWQRQGFGRWAVTESESGRLIGYCGLIRPGEDPHVAEVVYGFDVSAWGRGYATEAATAAREYASDVVGASTLVGFAHPDNKASHRVLTKLGLLPQGPRRFTDGRTLLEFSAPIGPNTLDTRRRSSRLSSDLSSLHDGTCSY